jgi:hypothetical protein
MLVYLGPQKSVELSPNEVEFVCPADSLILSIDSAVYTQNVVWGYCCQNELDFNRVDTTYSKYSRTFLGGTFGGYVYVEAETDSGCFSQDTVFVADMNPPPVNIKTIDTVINVSASKHRNIWKSVYSSVQWNSVEELLAFSDRLPYSNGSFGINRIHQTFDYVDTVAQTDYQNQRVKLDYDGTFNDLKKFNWFHPKFLYCAPEWKLNTTSTNYNTGSFGIEGKDILQRYSAALYSYNGTLQIAAAVNAGYEEIGFESFEEYANNNFNQLNNATGNLDIVPQIVGGFRYPYELEYEIEAAFGKYALVDGIEGNPCCDIPLDVKFSGRTVEKDLKKWREIEVKMKAQVFVDNTICKTDGKPDLKLVTFKVTDNSKPFQPFWDSGRLCDRFWTGTLLVEKSIAIDTQLFPKITLADSVAHTGRRSVRIDSGYTSIPQYDLHLKPDKNYVVSAWVHNEDIATNPPEKLETINRSNGIALYLKSGNRSVAFYPKGEVIEGWQRIEGIINITEKDKIPYIEFLNAEPFYLDDVRIYPENASMKTFVYNTENYRLNAELDENNYATLFQYNDKGWLFSVKKETVEGIKTIQATQSYIKTAP